MRRAERWAGFAPAQTVARTCRVGFLAAGDAPSAFVAFQEGRWALGYDLGVQTRRDPCRVDPGDPWRDRKTADALGIVVPLSPPWRAGEGIP